MEFPIVYDMTILNKYPFLVFLRPGANFLGGGRIWVGQVNIF